MPNALVSDVVTLSRRLLNEPLNSGRFNDSAMIGFVEQASKFMNRDILFPTAHWVIETVAYQQEYTIEPGVIITDSVYLNGQLLIPTDGGINTLEGHQIGLYDQGGVGLALAGGAGPPGGTGQYGPQWISATPQLYPIPNAGGGFPAPTGLPFLPGQRGRYYWNGGNLGITPAPSAAGQMLFLRGIMFVPKLSYLTDPTLFPDAMALAMAWKVCEFAKFSDDSDRAAEARNYAASQYDKEMRQWRLWNRRRTGDQPRTLQVRTNRSAYIRGNRTYGSGGFGPEY